MQTTFKKDYTPFMLGMVTPGGVQEAITLGVESTVEFGVPVTRTTTPDSCIPLPNNTSAIVGIAQLSHNVAGNYAPDSGDSSNSFAPILTKGTIIVLVDAGADALLVGKKAYAIPAPVAGGAYYAFTTDATDNVECGVFQNNAQNGMAQLKIDIVG